MFEYKTKVAGSISYGYRILLQQIAYEASEKLQREVTLAEVEKGIKYKFKDPKKKEQVTITLGPMNPNRHLVTRYTRAGQTTVMTYDFKDEKDGEFLLIYRQEDAYPEISGFQKMMTERMMKKRFKKLSELIIKTEIEEEQKQTTEE